MAGDRISQLVLVVLVVIILVDSGALLSLNGLAPVRKSGQQCPENMFFCKEMGSCFQSSCIQVKKFTNRMGGGQMSETLCSQDSTYCSKYSTCINQNCFEDGSSTEKLTKKEEYSVEENNKEYKVDDGLIEQGKKSEPIFTNRKNIGIDTGLVGSVFTSTIEPKVYYFDREPNQTGSPSDYSSSTQDPKIYFIDQLPGHNDTNKTTSMGRNGTFDVSKGWQCPPGQVFCIVCAQCIPALPNGTATHRPRKGLAAVSKVKCKIGTVFCIRTGTCVPIANCGAILATLRITEKQQDGLETDVSACNNGRMCFTWEGTDRWKNSECSAGREDEQYQVECSCNEMKDDAKFNSSNKSKPGDIEAIKVVKVRVLNDFKTEVGLQMSEFISVIRDQLSTKLQLDGENIRNLEVVQSESPGNDGEMSRCTVIRFVLVGNNVNDRSRVERAYNNLNGMLNNGSFRLNGLNGNPLNIPRQGQDDNTMVQQVQMADSRNNTIVILSSVLGGILLLLLVIILGVLYARSRKEIRKITPQLSGLSYRRRSERRGSSARPVRDVYTNHLRRGSTLSIVSNNTSRGREGNRVYSPSSVQSAMQVYPISGDHLGRN